jgi:hypothetical protein
MSKQFYSRQFVKYRDIIKSGTVTERDILNLKKLLNGYSKSSTTPEERKTLNDMIWDADGLKLTPEQTAKGIAWLRNQWKTPRGIERKHNPFGYREEEILENFSHFTFVGFYDNANFYMSKDGYHNYQPIYDVWGKLDDGSTSCFQYYMARGSGYNGGSVEIIG